MQKFTKKMINKNKYLWNFINIPLSRYPYEFGIYILR